MPDAKVTDLPEHEGNPFCAVLGPPPSLRSVMEIVERKPAFDPSERRLPAHLRRYCVMRLFDDGFVSPQTRQLQLVERIHMVIRNGYKHRNPAEGGYRKAILDAVDRSEAGTVEMAGRRVGSSAVGLTLIGQPGLGKTLVTDLALASIPLTARPDIGDSVVQVPWLKVECPLKATRRQFCIEFFEALDRRLGQDAYRKRYGNIRESKPIAMLLHVQLLCHVHAIGVLVIDEVQNLVDSPEGPETMMAFLVSLVNKIGVPVLAIGTMKATRVIGRDFRQARRSAGLHAPVWLRAAEGDADWHSLVTELWQYQWTTEHTELTDDLRAALYRHSQGIADVLVKLFVLTQFRVILLGQVPNPAMFESTDDLWVSGRRREVITADLIAEVARDDMHVVQPMIHALREGREDVLEQWHDLRGFHDHVSSVLGRHIGRGVDEFREARSRAEAERAAVAAAPDDALAPVRAFLAARGMAPDLVAETLSRAAVLAPDADAFTILDAVRRVLDGEGDAPVTATPAPVPASTAVPAPRAERRRGSAPVPTVASALPHDDLRAVAARAREAGVEVHVGLVAAGVAVPAQRAWAT